MKYVIAFFSFFFSLSVVADVRNAGLRANLTVNAKVLKPKQSESLSISAPVKSFILIYDRRNNKFNDIQFTLTLESSTENVTLNVDHEQAFCDNVKVNTSINTEHVETVHQGNKYILRYKVSFNLSQQIAPSTDAVLCNGLFFMTGSNEF